jgi:hypothetical protein
MAERIDGAGTPTHILYFVRCIESLAGFHLIDHYIRSYKLIQIYNGDIEAHAWTLINKRTAWKRIATDDRVKALFRNFDLGASGADGGPGPQQGHPHPHREARRQDHPQGEDQGNRRHHFRHPHGKEDQGNYSHPNREEDQGNRHRHPHGKEDQGNYRHPNREEDQGNRHRHPHREKDHRHHHRTTTTTPHHRRRQEALTSIIAYQAAGHNRHRNQT